MRSARVVVSSLLPSADDDDDMKGGRVIMMTRNRATDDRLPPLPFPIPSVDTVSCVYVVCAYTLLQTYSPTTCRSTSKRSGPYRTHTIIYYLVDIVVHVVQSFF